MYYYVYFRFKNIYACATQSRMPMMYSYLMNFNQSVIRPGQKLFHIKKKNRVYIQERYKIHFEITHYWQLFF